MNLGRFLAIKHNDTSGAVGECPESEIGAHGGLGEGLVVIDQTVQRCGGGSFVAVGNGLGQVAVQVGNGL